MGFGSRPVCPVRPLRADGDSTPMRKRCSRDIAGVAKRSGVPASTLRFYEEQGPIVSLGPARCAPPVRAGDSRSAGADHTGAPSHAECPTFQRLVKAAAESALAGKRERGRMRKGKTGSAALW